MIAIGWLGGALINYLADVLPIRMRLVPPFCQSCQATQPLANYLFWPRRCLVCGKRRAARSWVVEGIAAAVSVWIWLAPPQRLGFLPGFGVLIYFGVVAVIDLEHRLILRSLSLVGLLLGSATGVWLQWQRSGVLSQSLLLTLLGGAAGFGVMLLLYYSGGLFAKWMARRRGENLEEEALGFGDVHLGLILGLFLGWPVVFLGLAVGVMFGGLASLAYLAVKVLIGKHRWFTAIPYGPYLIAGAVFLLYFRDVFVASLAR